MERFQAIFDAQKAYFSSGITRNLEWRLRQLELISRLVRENEPQLQRAVADDFKTAPQEQVFETLSSIMSVESHKKQLPSWMEPLEVPVPKALAASGHRALVYRDPYGVVLIIGPFNGPLTLLLRPAIEAISAGNTCILKLSEKLDATSTLLLELILKYFDPRVIAAVSGHREETAALLKLPFDFIFFTGSTATGKVVARAAAENLTPIILELGGQNPALVDCTANVADAAKKIIWGATAWGGQWCTSPGYACVHEVIAEEFVAEAKKALLELYGPDPKSNPDYSKIIDEAAVSRLVGLLDPAKVVAGGFADPQARYLAPTILYPVLWEDPVMAEEVFGPVLPVLVYKDLNEALSRISALPHPLSAFVFSRDQTVVDRFVSELSFGGGAVNQVNIHLFVGTMPFGGVGPAGMGHYYGKYGFDMLTHGKGILISPPDIALEHLFPPYTAEKVADLKMWFDY